MVSVAGRTLSSAFIFVQYLICNSGWPGVSLWLNLQDLTTSVVRVLVGIFPIYRGISPTLPLSLPGIKGMHKAFPPSGAAAAFLKVFDHRQNFILKINFSEKHFSEYFPTFCCS